MPATIELNANLVSIIGSRSSGKSALLAYIAHPVDPQYTRDQQGQAQPHVPTSELGPAAGIAWGSDESVRCEVEWADGKHAGKVIYIPQNSLFALSSRPEEITQKIAPALTEMDFDFGVDHAR